MKTENINGKPIACYDNGGATIDRYTVAYLFLPHNRPKFYDGVAMNHEPFHPQGFGQHTTMMIGKHLGKRISFDSLPIDCQKLVKQDLE